MSITATVEKGSIKLPIDVHLPDGTEVRIELPEPSARVAGFDDWLKTAAGAATSGLTTDQIMKETRGEESRPRDWVDRATGGATSGLTTDEIMRRSRGDE